MAARGVMLTIPPVFDVMLMWSLIIFLYAWVGTLLFLGTAEGTSAAALSAVAGTARCFSHGNVRAGMAGGWVGGGGGLGVLCYQAPTTSTDGARR